MVPSGEPRLFLPLAVRRLRRPDVVDDLADLIEQGPGRWADPQRAATDVATAIRLTGLPDRVPGRLNTSLSAPIASRRGSSGVTSPSATA